METAELFRVSTSDQGTKGVLTYGEWECCILELPWRDNQNYISCIPTGIYTAKFIIHSKYGPCYWLRSVPGRTGILIHTGNLAGDESKGWITHSAGCPLIGDRFGTLDGQEAVLLSRKTLRQFVDNVMNREDFKLTIKELY